MSSEASKCIKEWRRGATASRGRWDEDAGGGGGAAAGGGPRPSMAMRSEGRGMGIRDGRL